MKLRGYGFAASRHRLLPERIDLADRGALCEQSGALFPVACTKEAGRRTCAKVGADPALAHIPLRIAGPGADDYVQRVQAAADATANVRYVGPVYGQDKTVLLAEAAFFFCHRAAKVCQWLFWKRLPKGVLSSPRSVISELIERGCAIPMRRLVRTGRILAVMAAITPDDMAARANLSRAVATDYAWPTIGAAMLDHYAALLSAHGDNGREKGR
jgi:hypothetical protein